MRKPLELNSKSLPAKIKGALDYKFQCLLSDPLLILHMTGESALFLVVVSSSVTKGFLFFFFFLIISWAFLSFRIPKI